MAPTGHMITPANCGTVESWIHQNEGSRTFLDGHSTGYRGVSEREWPTEGRMIHTRTFLPIILSHKLIELSLSIAGMHPTALKCPITLLAPMCATAQGTAQLGCLPKVCNVHGRRLMAAMTVMWASALDIWCRNTLPWTFNCNRDLVHLQPDPLDQHRFVYPQGLD